MASPAVFAGTDGPGTDRFDRADAKHDGVASRIEAQDVVPTIIDRMFDMADENHGGVLEEVEFPLLHGLIGAIGGFAAATAAPRSGAVIVKAVVVFRSTDLSRFGRREKKLSLPVSGAPAVAAPPSAPGSG